MLISRRAGFFNQSSLSTDMTKRRGTFYLPYSWSCTSCSGEPFRANDLFQANNCLFVSWTKLVCIGSSHGGCGSVCSAGCVIAVWGSGVNLCGHGWCRRALQRSSHLLPCVYACSERYQPPLPPYNLHPERVVVMHGPPTPPQGACLSAPRGPAGSYPAALNRRPVQLRARAPNPGASLH